MGARYSCPILLITTGYVNPVQRDPPKIGGLYKCQYNGAIYADHVLYCNYGSASVSLCHSANAVMVFRAETCILSIH
jgi:hypothetical protein